MRQQIWASLVGHTDRLRGLKKTDVSGSDSGLSPLTDDL